MSRNKVTQLIVIVCLGLLTLLIAQENQLSYISQKLTLENSVKERVTTALDKLLDDIKFVVDVKVEIEFTPMEQTRTVIGSQPEAAAEKAAVPTPKTTPTPAKNNTVQTTRQPSSETSLPLPGFEMPPTVAQPKEQAPVQTQVSSLPQETAPVEENAPQPPPDKPAQTASQNISTSIQKTTIPVPIVKRQEISIILEDGVSPETIENVRQIVAVAAHYDRVRGDVISIMTANFKKSPTKDATETIILKNIAEKIDDIEKRQSDAEYNTRIEQQKRFERQAIVRDSLKIDDLKKQIAALQMQLQTPQISDDQRQATQQQTTARETELNNLRDQLKESNRRLQELEFSSLETTPPSMFGIRNLGMWYAIIAAAVLFLALLIVLLVNHRKQEKRQELEWGYGSKIPLGPRPTPAIPIRKPAEPAAPQAPVQTSTQSVPPTPPPVQSVPSPTPAAPVASAAPPVDLDAQKEEMKSMKQSVISMTVGQPDTASRIINSWMSQEVQRSESETES